MIRLSDRIPFSQRLSLRPHIMPWLGKVLADFNRHLFIILNEDSEIIGQVRFDVDGDKAEINIGLSAEYRGKGYGVESIRHSSSWFLQQHPEVGQISSRIKLANQASIKAFAKAGYSQDKEVDQVIYMVYKKLRCGA